MGRVPFTKLQTHLYLEKMKIVDQGSLTVKADPLEQLFLDPEFVQMFSGQSGSGGKLLLDEEEEEEALREKLKFGRQDLIERAMQPQDRENDPYLINFMRPFEGNLNNNNNNNNTDNNNLNLNNFDPKRRKLDTQGLVSSSSSTLVNATSLNTTSLNTTSLNTTKLSTVGSSLININTNHNDNIFSTEEEDLSPEAADIDNAGVLENLRRAVVRDHYRDAKVYEKFSHLPHRLAHNDPSQFDLVAMMRAAGLGVVNASKGNSNDPFFVSKAAACLKLKLVGALEKSKYCMPCSCYVKVQPAPKDLLPKHGEFALCLSNNNIDSDLSPRVVTGLFFLVKNPCYEPENLVVGELVDRPELRARFPAENILFCSHLQGTHGDFDGDGFFVCWEPDIVDHLAHLAPKDILLRYKAGKIKMRDGDGESSSEEAEEEESMAVEVKNNKLEEDNGPNSNNNNLLSRKRLLTDEEILLRVKQHKNNVGKVAVPKAVARFRRKKRAAYKYIREGFMAGCGLTYDDQGDGDIVVYDMNDADDLDEEASKEDDEEEVALLKQKEWISDAQRVRASMEVLQKSDLNSSSSSSNCNLWNVTPAIDDEVLNVVTANNNNNIRTGSRCLFANEHWLRKRRADADAKAAKEKEPVVLVNIDELKNEDEEEEENEVDPEVVAKKRIERAKKRKEYEKQKEAARRKKIFRNSVENIFGWKQLENNNSVTTTSTSLNLLSTNTNCNSNSIKVLDYRQFCETNLKTPFGQTFAPILHIMKDKLRTFAESFLTSSIGVGIQTNKFMSEAQLHGFTDETLILAEVCHKAANATKDSLDPESLRYKPGHEKKKRESRERTLLWRKLEEAHHDGRLYEELIRLREEELPKFIERFGERFGRSSQDGGSSSSIFGHNVNTSSKKSWAGGGGARSEQLGATVASLCRNGSSIMDTESYYSGYGPGRSSTFGGGTTISEFGGRSSVGGFSNASSCVSESIRSFGSKSRNDVENYIHQITSKRFQKWMREAGFSWLDLIKKIFPLSLEYDAKERLPAIERKKLNPEHLQLSEIVTNESRVRAIICKGRTPIFENKPGNKYIKKRYSMTELSDLLRSKQRFVEELTPLLIKRTPRGKWHTNDYKRLQCYRDAGLRKTIVPVRVEKEEVVDPETGETGATAASVSVGQVASRRKSKKKKESLQEDEEKDKTIIAPIIPQDGSLPLVRRLADQGLELDEDDRKRLNLRQYEEEDNFEEEIHHFEEEEEEENINKIDSQQPDSSSSSVNLNNLNLDNNNANNNLNEQQPDIKKKYASKRADKLPVEMLEIQALRKTVERGKRCMANVEDYSLFDTGKLLHSTTSIDNNDDDFEQDVLAKQSLGATPLPTKMADCPQLGVGRDWLISRNNSFNDRERDSEVEIAWICCYLEHRMSEALAEVSKKRRELNNLQKKQDAKTKKKKEVLAEEDVEPRMRRRDYVINTNNEFTRAVHQSEAIITESDFNIINIDSPRTPPVSSTTTTTKFEYLSCLSKNDENDFDSLAEDDDSLCISPNEKYKMTSAEVKARIEKENRDDPKPPNCPKLFNTDSFPQQEQKLRKHRQELENWKARQSRRDARLRRAVQASSSSSSSIIDLRSELNNIANKLDNIETRLSSRSSRLSLGPQELGIDFYPSKTGRSLENLFYLCPLLRISQFKLFFKLKNKFKKERKQISSVCSFKLEPLFLLS